MPDNLNIHTFHRVIWLLVLSLSACAPVSAHREPVTRPTILGPAVSTTAAPRAVRTTLPAAPTFPAAAAATPVAAATTVATTAPTATLPPTLAPTLAAGDCSASPLTARLLQGVTAESWMAWVKQLSGAEPVRIAGQTVTLSTRYTPALFGGDAQAPTAFDFLRQTLQGWYPDDQIEVQPFTATRNETQIQGANLVLTLPGTSRKEETVILSAHLDSITYKHPEKTAPGAEDNASGSAALLEAARVFQDLHFQRTVKIIWFTGEEQGLLGSKAFVKQHVKDPSKIAGVINLDMFGYDSDGDGCFELHVGSLPASNQVGQCFLQSIQAYDLGLPHYDYLTQSAVSGSDHSSFWSANIGAVEVLENLFDSRSNQQDNPNACPNADPNPNYHTVNDTFNQLNPGSAVRLVRAALATAAGLAGLSE